MTCILILIKVRCAFQLYVSGNICRTDKVSVKVTNKLKAVFTSITH